jgi:hypothetical protein
MAVKSPRALSYWRDQPSLPASIPFRYFGAAVAFHLLRIARLPVTPCRACHIGGRVAALHSSRPARLR